MSAHKMICSAPDLEGIRSMVRQFWFLADDFDPLVATDDPRTFTLRSGKHPDGHPGLRVVSRGRRFRFEREV